MRLAAPLNVFSKSGVAIRPSTITLPGATAWMRARAVGKRVVRIDQWLLFGDRELDLVDDVLGLFLAGGDHGGDRLAGEAHFAVGEDRLADRLVVELVQHRRDRLEAFHIGGGDEPMRRPAP